MLNFEGLSFPYPLVAKQHTKLPIRKIFGRARGFRLDLEDNFLEGHRDSATWPNSSESLSGTTQLTFKRLRG